MQNSSIFMFGGANFGKKSSFQKKMALFYSFLTEKQAVESKSAFYGHKIE